MKSPYVQRFTRLWRELSATGNPEPVAHDLLARWSEPARHYHNLAHLADCLAGLDRQLARVDDAAVLEAALWFHDAIYDPRASDNESRSADLAREVLTRGNVLARHRDRIERLILSTRTHDNDGSSDNALLLDLDLSVLGSDPVAYARYADAIRREYAWVPEVDYREKRVALLTRFLKRPRLFLTAPFYRDLEAQARQNLALEIAHLTGPSPSRL